MSHIIIQIENNKNLSIAQKHDMIQECKKEVLKRFNSERDETIKNKLNLLCSELEAYRLSLVGLLPNK